MEEPDLITLFVRPLHEAGIAYLIAGSLGAMLYSEPRFTLDIDLPVLLDPRRWGNWIAAAFLASTIGSGAVEGNGLLQFFKRKPVFSACPARKFLYVLAPQEVEFTCPLAVQRDFLSVGAGRSHPAKHWWRNTGAPTIFSFNRPYAHD